MASNTLSRSLHDLGLSAWFGGSLANAVALNPAANAAKDAKSAGAVVNAGWDRWTPVNAAAIGAHLVGAAINLAGNKTRIKGQKGVGTVSLVKTGLTVAALGITGFSRVLGAKVSKHQDVAVEDGTTPLPSTPASVAAAQKQLKVLQWAIPVVTGALIVVTALAGEQQRPTNVVKGVLDRITG
jgi:uncharacterized membrane protein